MCHFTDTPDIEGQARVHRLAATCSMHFNSAMSHCIVSTLGAMWLVEPDDNSAAKRATFCHRGTVPSITQLLFWQDRTCIVAVKQKVNQ